MLIAFILFICLFIYGLFEYGAIGKTMKEFL